MDAAQYDAWYATPRGSWIGETEYRLLCQLLGPKPGETLLDIGCGTGYFTRHFAAEGFQVTGIDPDQRMLEFAYAHRTAAESYVLADARSLPFPDGAFDLCVSVTALCFIGEESRALAEMQRVARRRFAVGLLNRRSLLYLSKGRRGGQGAYGGARWHTLREVRALLAGAAGADIALATAVFVPTGRKCARLVERWLPSALPLGAFIVGAAEGRGRLA